jgi:hypothetical protein
METNKGTLIIACPDGPEDTVEQQVGVPAPDRECRRTVIKQNHLLTVGRREVTPIVAAWVFTVAGVPANSIIGGAVDRAHNGTTVARTLHVPRVAGKALVFANTKSGCLCRDGTAEEYVRAGDVGGMGDCQKLS